MPFPWFCCWSPERRDQYLPLHFSWGRCRLLRFPVFLLLLFLIRRLHVSITFPSLIVSTLGLLILFFSFCYTLSHCMLDTLKGYIHQYSSHWIMIVLTRSFILSRLTSFSTMLTIANFVLPYPTAFSLFFLLFSPEVQWSVTLSVV